jgi:phage terminase large subunit-like protein
MKQNDTTALIQHWRDIGPASWAQGSYGWIDDDGEPLTLAPWQAAVLLAWWDHRETVTTLGISNVKKTGKTTLNAVLLAWRWLAMPGLHFAAANDLDQSTSRQFSMIAEMVKRNKYLQPNTRVTNRDILFKPTDSVCQALSNDATGNAGANHLTASHTEAWGIEYEAAIRAYEELTPPPGKKYGLPALRIADSYAGFDGEASTWHNLVDRGLAGERISEDWPLYLAGGLLLFHMEGSEAQKRCFRGSQAEADAYYQEQAATLRENTFQRLHMNIRMASESRFLPVGTWDACKDSPLRPLADGDKRRVVLGADASTSRDLTAAVGSVWNDELQKVDVIHVKVWEPKRGWLRKGKPTIDLEETLGKEVLRLHDAGQLEAVVYDPFQLHSLAISWAKLGIKTIELPQTNARTEADQALYDAVLTRQLRHYGDPRLDEHINNAIAKESVRGYRLDKEKTSRKIDAAVALSMSHIGALENKRGGGMAVVRDPFANWPYPNEDERNQNPHPQGVTWHNCRYRNNGCVACEAELEREGYYEQLRAMQPMYDDIARNKRDERKNRRPPAPTPQELEYNRARQAARNTFENIRKSIGG